MPDDGMRESASWKAIHGDEAEAAHVRRREQLRRGEEDSELLQELRGMLARRREAHDIRAMIAELRAAYDEIGGIRPECDLGQWIAWALATADRLDPVTYQVQQDKTATSEL
jgi:hypothetical protein